MLFSSKWKCINPVWRFYLEYLLITMKMFFYENELRHFCKFYLEYLLITFSVYFFGKKYFEYLLITSWFLHILPRISAHYIFLTFSRRYSYFFRNENIKIMCEDFTSNICWLRSKIFFLMKMNCDIFENFTSNICSLRENFWFLLSRRYNSFSEMILKNYLFHLQHFHKFYLKYLLITWTFLIFCFLEGIATF